MLITRSDSYDETYRSFRWNIPKAYNIASDVCDRHAGGDAVALIHDRGTGDVRHYTFRDIQRSANRLANVFSHYGLARGSFVAILLGQDPEAGITHVACWKAGLVSVTISRLFGVEAVEHRLGISDARVLVTDKAGWSVVAPIRDRLPHLQHVLIVDGVSDGASDFYAAIARASDHFLNIGTSSADPAFMNFTSGTTGPAKGVLKAHRAMIGVMPSIEFCHDFFPQPGDLFWSPADWSWLAGFMNILMPAWFHGKPVLAFRASSFDPEQAVAMMVKHRVRNSLLTPTMLKMLRQVGRLPEALDLRSVVSGSEAVGAELVRWAQDALKVNVNVVFGQTECNSTIGNNGRVMPFKAGALGRAMPGHVCAVVDDSGQEVAPGTIGNIAFRRPDPLMLLEYWRDAKATAAKFISDWMITGDLGTCDEEGYFWFHARADDIISSSGYRIGPGEIEDVLIKHPDVAMAAVIGVPDPVRNESIKAFIVLSRSVVPSDDIKESIRTLVKTRLAKHEAPRDIEIVDALPLSANGKILRRELREREIRKMGGSS
ncbi:AMP-binding protein [Bradyrhizobium japonicum]|jgi:acetyl-CoA synthetase|uniref:AMP-binding protein n=2 Tax=Bradyrhizobium TaxID=374 RepID=UPI0004166A96|nr:AMP-binding protein [Bradyrhizobium japonicum]